MENEMYNKVERLRALCFSEEDMKTIKGVEEFSPIEIRFMEQFKRVYEFGEDQVSIFMDMLNEGGYLLNVYSIMYYVDLLKNGPMKPYFHRYRGTKRYYRPLPDVMASTSNINRTPSNVSIIQKDIIPMGSGVEIDRKLPTFMKSLRDDATSQCEEMFRSNMDSSTMYDNTLPLVDKMPQSRCNMEPTGQWSSYAHGNYMVKDIDWNNVVVSANPSVLNEAWNYIAKYQENKGLFGGELSPPVGTGPGEENWRVWWTLRNHNPFSPTTSDESVSTSKYIHNKTITEGGISREFSVDLFNEELESFERRQAILKVETEETDTEYKIYTNKGQLGS